MQSQIADTVSAINKLSINQSYQNYTKIIQMPNTIQSINKPCQMPLFYKNIIDMIQKQLPNQDSLIYNDLRMFFIKFEQWKEYNSLCGVCIKYRSRFGSMFSKLKKKMVQFVDTEDISMSRIAYHKFPYFLKQCINQSCNCIELNSMKVN